MKDQTLELTEEKDENTTIILHKLTKCKNKAREFFFFKSSYLSSTVDEIPRCFKVIRMLSMCCVI